MVNSIQTLDEVSIMFKKIKNNKVFHKQSAKKTRDTLVGAENQV